MKSYFWNLLIALDQFANTAIGGDPDETISSRFGRAIREGRCRGCRLVCRVLHWLDPNHCDKSVEGDEGRYETWPLSKHKADKK